MPKNPESGPSEDEPQQAGEQSNKEEFEKITVSEILEKIRGNVDAQKEVFGEKLSDEDFDEMLKVGVKAEHITKIMKVLGYKFLSLDIFNELKEMAERGELKVDDIYIHPEEGEEK